MKSNLQALSLLMVSAENADEFLRRAKAAFKDFYRESMLLPAPQNDEGKKAFILGYFSEHKLKKDFLDCVDAFSVSTNELLMGIVDIRLSEDDVIKFHWYPGPPKLTDQEQLITTTDGPGAPAESEKTSIAVYVVARDSNGAPEMLAIELPFDQDSYDDGAHYEEAERRATEAGFQVLCSFDANDPASKAVNREACISIPLESDCAANAPTPS